MVNSVSGINASVMYAVSAVQMGGSHLSEELIKKLKQLGIDPATVKSESEARALIAQAEKSQSKQPTNNVQPQAPSHNVDMKQLNDDIKALGDKLGIDVKMIQDKKELIDKLDAGVKEFVQGASAQSNTSDITVKMKNGMEVTDNPQQMQVEFNSIKDRVEQLENAKNAMFAGQDMLAMMNRMRFGI